jgi:hypothetical protein
MRGVLPVELPPAAREKLTTLELQRDSALDASRSCQSRINQLPRDADPRMQERLASDQGKHAERHRTLSMIVSRCNQWCMELRLPPGSTLQSASAEVRLKNGETVSAAVEATRGEIKTLSQRLGVVKIAPPPLDEQLDRAKEFVARRALLAKPKVAVQRDALRVFWYDDVITSRTDVLNLLCWAAPDMVLVALQDMIGESSPSNAMPAVERDKQIDHIERRLFELELQEEALISHAAADGVDILRRSDASPLAVLGVAPADSAVEAA